MGSYPAGRRLIVCAGEEQPDFPPLNDALIALVWIYCCVSKCPPPPLYLLWSLKVGDNWKAQISFYEVETLAIFLRKCR